MNFKELLSKPCISSWAIKSSWGRQSKAFDRSVSNAPNAPPLSTLSFYFSIRVAKCVIASTKPALIFRQ